jgi:hypothetical protein
MTTDVSATLAERGKRYGDFKDHAAISQGLKEVLRQTPGWARLNPPMKEGLEMILHKVGRILNGDPTYADSWHDIAGYAKLVEDHLSFSEGVQAVAPQVTVERPLVSPTTAPPVVTQPPPAVQAPASPVPEGAQPPVVQSPPPPPTKSPLNVTLPPPPPLPGAKG